MVVWHHVHPSALLATVVWLSLSLIVVVESQDRVSVDFFDNSMEVEEGDHFNIRLKRTGNIGDFVVIVQVENDLNDDIVGTTQVASFSEGGSIYSTVSFTVNDDDLPEDNEAFYFRLYTLDPRARPGRKDRLFVTVKANDDAFGVFKFGQSSPVVTKERPYSSTLSIKIIREVASFETIDVSYIVNSTSEFGILGMDIYPVTGRVNFQPNQKEADLELQIRPDDVPENDESYYVMLTSATNNAKIDKTPLQVIIQANDAAIRFTKAMYRFEEGPKTKSVAVTLTRGISSDGETRIGPINEAVTLEYFFRDDSAKPVDDYIGTSGKLTFAPGETSKLINFLIMDDTIPEKEEEFSVRIYNIQGDAVWIEPKAALVIINANDNPSGILGIRPDQDGDVPLFQVNEDSFTTLDIYVDRSDGTFGDVRVEWSILRDRGSTPVADDIGPISGTLFFADGENEAVISLTVVQDNDPEAAEMLLVRLDPSSVTGNAKVDGISEARVLLEDSDNVYGTVEFGPGSDHRIDTTELPRSLRVSLTRSGARLDDLDLNISVSYDDGTHELDTYNVFEEPEQAVIMPSGQDPVEVVFKLMPNTFLVVGGEFTANITGIGFVDPLVYGAFNSPKLGPRRTVSVFVSPTEANGETGFFNITNVEIDEPESGVADVILLVSREGLSGTATVGWSIAGDSVTTDDVVALSGTVTLQSGTSETYLTVGIKADDIPELSEFLIVTLDNIQPSDNQRLRPGSNRLVITVHSNDNPGGIISFSSEMKANYLVEEGLMPIEVIVERTGGALEERSVKYSMEPNGGEEFFGATNVLFFPPGQRTARATILAKKDGKPELLEKYSLVLTSVGDPPATLGGATSIPVEIEESDDPNGIIQFETDPTIAYTAEGLAGEQINITLKVRRDWGTFGVVEVPWFLQPSVQNDLIPSSGTLVFEDSQTEGFLHFIVVNDQIPEPDETYAVQLMKPTGRATGGIPTVATIVILENDNPVEFKEPLVYTTEPSIITLTVTRSGRLETVARLYYRSLDGSASSVDKDYTQINTQEMVFAAGEKEKTIQVEILDDTNPEGNETFTVQLFDVGGDLITTDSSTATIVVKSNDDAYGVFSFAPPAGVEVEEGSVGFLNIIRDKGNFGSVDVLWEIRTLNNIPLSPGEDFEFPTGQVTFSPQENKRALSVSPLADRIPETSERFLLVLTRVQVISGIMSTGLASISDQFVVATITVSSSDDPFGHMAFSRDARELKVAEDFNPGDEASTQATFVVERRQGTQDTVKVLWEVFSEELGGNLPVTYDFLFSGQSSVPMQDEVSKRRPGTATPVLLFSGAAGQFVTVLPSANPVMANLARGFSLSAWVQPLGTTDGYILARCTDDGSTHYYSLRLATFDSSTTLTLSLSSDAQTNDISSVSIPSTTQDGKWHHVFVVVDNTTVSFFMDGEKVGTRTRVESSFLDGPNTLLVGARPPGLDLFNGYLQDVRLFVRAMDQSTVKEIYSSSSFKDVTQISGTLTYGEGVKTQSFTIGSKQDIEEEGREVFNLKLLTTTGGATLSTTDSQTTLSVLKSDNANGLFAFVDKCTPARTQTESIEFTCVVDRLRGDDGSVSVSWVVQQRIGSVVEEAVDDFVETTGIIVFLRGERKKEFTVQSKEDTVPELDEIFEIHLVSAESDDEIVGSTSTSGASIDENRASSQIVIEQNDYPYGLLQFSNSLKIVPPPGVIISPVDGPVKVMIGEETGTISLIVQRAQGTLLEIRSEWRTKDLTALSEGKIPPDYVGAVGSVVMEDGVNYAFVNITLKDNAIPEAEKTFEVELLNPTGGAELGPGAKVQVTIEASDAAFGVFQFDDSQLTMTVTEDRGVSFTLEVKRLGGSIDVVELRWEVVEGQNDGFDIVEQDGVITFQSGQTSQLIQLHVRDDTLPELDEVISVKLLGPSKGELGDPLKTTAEVNILANDDPYGKFIIPDSFRPIRVLEKDQDISITIQRVGGVYGSVDIDFRTLSVSESLPYLPGPVSKAQAADFTAKQGRISFVDNQEFAEFFIPILDDTDPERDESIFVILTDVTLVRASQLREIDGSPRLGIGSETYAQIIISSNDDANGRLTLSPISLSIEESNPIPQVELVRSGGAFGEVTVAFRVIDGTAKLNLDYVVLSPVIILGPEETKKRVPVEVIDDRVPELSEDFTIELVNSVSGGAVLGDNTSAVVTILPSDDPNGLFEFVTTEQTVKEGEQKYDKEITVSRTGGSIDVVQVDWDATLNGELASDDISPSSGSLRFVTNEASRKIKITILPDTIPEGSEAISIHLISASNGGKIGGKNTHVLTIAPNDSPHGVIAFSSPSFTVQEGGSSQSVQIIRSDGDYGQLKVYYTTSALSIVDLMSINNENYLGIYKPVISGEPPEGGNLVDVSRSGDTVRACASACSLTVSCLSFVHLAREDNSILCSLYDLVFHAEQLIRTSSQAKYYVKDTSQVQSKTMNIAKSGEDFLSVQQKIIVLEDGQTSASVPLTIINDDLPELGELFWLELVKVEVADSQYETEEPKLGDVVKATVSIAVNDNAFGVFSISSSQAVDNTVSVEEADKKAVDFVVTREGGSIGSVTIDWAISAEDRTAVYNQDFIADGATLVFDIGQTQRVISITLLDDSIPETDRELTVILRNPTSGATIGSPDSIKVVILANDYVAGVLSFEISAVLAKEGDTFEVKVKRSLPALGVVKVDWILKGLNGLKPEESFQFKSGSLEFLQTEIEKTIQLDVLPDEKPETNEEFTLTLENIVTEGIGPTGAAIVDPQSAEVLITIASSDDPHGVFQFASNSLQLTVEEDVGKASLAVDRKFGAIGNVRVSFEVTQGSVTTLPSRTNPASSGQDFVAVASGFINIPDGQPSGNIDITIIDDGIPEINEIFVVRLTGVALTDIADPDLPPKLIDNGTEAEITIKANDGAQGIIYFAQDSVRVTTNEMGQDISLTVVRANGTFDIVSVFYYSQAISESAQEGTDFVLTPGDLEFKEGESRKNIVITIKDDALPEPSEMFEVILASPRNGALLGDDIRATITILANDMSGGFISFESPDTVILTEEAKPDGGTKVSVNLVRGPGSFGSIQVPFTITTALGALTDDILPKSGTIDFADRQTSAVLEIEAINDNIPETEETFTLSLQSPTGQSQLGNTKTLTITISQNDSPFGLLQLFTLEDRLSKYTVEEKEQMLKFEIVRNQGTQGRISVDMVTIPGSAMASRDFNRIVLAPMDNAPSASTIGWHQVNVGENTFMVVLTSLPSSTQLVSQRPSLSSAGTGQSSIYKWQGQLSLLRTFSSDGASAATSFVIDGITYLVVANGGREGTRDVSSNVYLVTELGEMEVVQGLQTSGASDVEFFTYKSHPFLMVTNSLDSNSNSDIDSHMYTWDQENKRFLTSQLIPTLYAKAVTSFTIDGQVYVVIANYYNRVTGSYEINSAVYRMESDSNLVQHQQLRTQGAIDVTSINVGDTTHLVIANNREDIIVEPQDSVVYRWDYLTQSFILLQTLPTKRARSVKALKMDTGSSLLIFANAVGSSEIFKWEVESGRYKSVWKGGPYLSLVPMTIQQTDSILYLMGSAEIDRLGDTNLFQIAEVAEGSDFVPRRVTMTFEPGETRLEASVVISTDKTPEDTEQFSVTLLSPTNGAELGENQSVDIEILSNDDAHGVVEFAQDSLKVTTEEKENEETTVILNVQRKLGFFGRIRVAWQASGDHSGVGDITPLGGQVEFANGQSVATITVSVRDDLEAEFAEVTYIRLTEVVETGTDLDAKGARLGTNVESMITVLANDSPYGVIMWEKSSVTVQEPEESDQAVEMTILRRQGLEKAIRVTYVTSTAYNVPDTQRADSGEDYVSVQGAVDMTEGQAKAFISIVIKQDDLPEAAESFQVNLTSAALQGEQARAGSGPSIGIEGSVVEVTIVENDNARGIVQIDAVTNLEGRLDVYEEYGKNITVEIPVRRLVGFFGAVTVSWQAKFIEADILDFFPTGGAIIFNDQQQTSVITITIIDDKIPEPMETFDIELISVDGGAGLGTTTSVRVAILENDSPTGFFKFATLEVETHESETADDPDGQAILVIQRLHGVEGTVDVRWRLNAEAENDFLPPLQDTVKFVQGEVQKSIVLQTKPDTILEGRENFIVSLVAANNKGDISQTASDCAVVILPDPGSSGIITVLPEFRQVIIGEPGESDPSYTGQVVVELTRGAGVYGEVDVTWSLTPRDISAFFQVQGIVRFDDLQEKTSIVLRARDDSTSELKKVFSLQITSATGGAAISTTSGEFESSVLFAASDYPHGLIQFSAPEIITVSEDAATIQLKVERGKGIVGQLLVAYSTSPGTATSQNDFLPSTGFLTFMSGVTEQIVDIRIVPDDIAEGPEYFYVNLTSVEMVNDVNDYTVSHGLSKDMPPALGPLSVKTITISKNDDAEGFIQFNNSAEQMAVREEIKVATISVVRLTGSYGEVSVKYVTEGLTAVEDDDYMAASGTLTLEDAQVEGIISITIKDDALRESAETFKVILSDVTGGAQLGSITTSTVTILKSDYPNGRFSFQGQPLITLPNPVKANRQLLFIERSDGVRGAQQVFWRIMGPNNPNLQLEDTSDISSSVMIDGQEVTSGSLRWSDGESGEKKLSLSIKPYVSWEVEKTFVVEIFNVVGSSSDLEVGEIDDAAGHVKIKILRFGEPNGIIRFTGAAIDSRLVQEPNGPTPASIAFPVARRSDTGVTGNIQIYWKVEGEDISDADVTPIEGSVLLEDGHRNGQITLQILPDDEPELTEILAVKLVRVEGGAQIDSQLDQSYISIQYNDFPHGEFGVIEDFQSIDVDQSDLSRYVNLNFTRFQGTFGSVMLTFTIKYDSDTSAATLESNSGTVTFNSGETNALTRIAIVGNNFISMDSTFTVTITEVQYLGQVSQSPSIRSEYSSAKIVVPSHAANSYVSFSTDLTTVDEETSSVTVILVRMGSYGALSVDWTSGYPVDDLRNGFRNGEMTPVTGSVSMAHGQIEEVITVQVSPQVNEPESFVLRLFRAPQSFVNGGARLAPTNLMVRVDPYGMVRFADDSLTTTVSELDGKVTLDIWRLYGSQGRIAIYYSTQPDTADKDDDFEAITNNAIFLEEGKTMGTFDIEIKQDKIPEQNEMFYVSLLTVERFPTPAEPVTTPRISKLNFKSHVTIRESDDVYGVFSMTPTHTDVNEVFTTVTLKVIRSGGLFGTVSISVKTVGGGEEWTNQIVPRADGDTIDTIADVLGKRNPQTNAKMEEDYNVLDTVVEFKESEAEKEVILQILEDGIPEGPETVLIYLTRPEGGARIAEGDSDAGKKGFAVVTIQSNDISNGIIGFTQNSRSVQANEDETPTLVLQLLRVNAYIGDVKVMWKAKLNATSSEIADDEKLRLQLVEIKGDTYCSAGQSICDLTVQLKPDEQPEEGFTFIVMLTGAETDAQINEQSKIANVDVLPSDDVRGLIEFSEDSRVVVVGEDDESVRLSVSRTKGKGYDVTAVYSTHQMADVITVSGVKMYLALASQDFRTATNTLRFLENSGEDSQVIEILLTPDKASDEPLPKQFEVRLSSPSNGARINLDADTAIVQIVKDSDVAIARVVSAQGEDIYPDDAKTLNVVNNLDDIVQDGLSDYGLDLTEYVLRKINEEGEKRKLSNGLVEGVRNLYCKLLNSKSDARKGRSSLADVLEGFAYVLLKNTPCPPSIGEELQSTECSNVKISAGRWLPQTLAAHEFNAQSKVTFTSPETLPTTDSSLDGNNDQCLDFHFVEYSSTIWFERGSVLLMNDKVVSFGLKNKASARTSSPVRFKIATSNNKGAAKGAKCGYFDTGSKKWVTSSDICKVTNNLKKETDKFVSCECSHMSNYAVLDSESSDDETLIGYVAWFYVVVFVAMTFILIAVIVNHTCFSHSTFSASLHMHFLMSIFFTLMCLVLDTFLSSDHSLLAGEDEDNTDCTVMGLFAHYFFLCQFTWIVAQSINFWKILIMNDEHSNRFYCVFFTIGWGLPIVMVAMFFAVTFNIYKYHTDISEDFIYDRVSEETEICFISNEYTALAGILAPVLVCLLICGVVFVKAYQMAPQWQSYDDVYRGRYNSKEIPYLLLIWALLCLSTLWLALHMVYGKLWMMILFCVFQLLMAIFILVIYAIVRNPYFSWLFGPVKSSYAVSNDGPYPPIHDSQYNLHTPIAASVKGSQTSILNDAWEKSTERDYGQMTVRRALPSQVYINPPVAVISPSNTVDGDTNSLDFDDLIYALKMGRSLTPSELSRSLDDDLSQLSVPLDRYETKRINIADTHL